MGLTARSPLPWSPAPHHNQKETCSWSVPHWLTTERHYVPGPPAAAEPQLGWQENDGQGCPNLTLGAGRGAKGLRGPGVETGVKDKMPSW